MRNGKIDKFSEQLKTMHLIPKDFARSLMVSVFPLPVGPSRAAPNDSVKVLANDL